jgi:Icc-related predicted phosphoesterase
MKALLVTDIHGDVENLRKIMEEEEFDIAFCAGDLSDANEFDDYSGKLDEVLDIFEDHSSITKAVPGNMDPEEECVEELRHRRMNVHRDNSGFRNVEVAGFGGGQTPFGTPFEPEGSEIKSVLEHLIQRMNAQIKIGVIHQPPHGTALDLVDGEHVGSREVRELIEESDFDLVLTGHIHESSGTGELNNTGVVNPGAVVDGKYGVAEISDSGIQVEMRSLH